LISVILPSTLSPAWSHSFRVFYSNSRHHQFPLSSFHRRPWYSNWQI